MTDKTDIISPIYKELFSVRFLHTGYGTPPSNTIGGDIQLYPDENTRKLFAGHNIGYRIFNDRLVCFMRSKLFAAPAPEPKVPFIPFRGDVVIRFLMYTTGNFMNKTAVVAAGKKLVYQFSNRLNNAIATNQFISQPVETHDLLKDYDAGTIVQKGGLLFMTIKPLLASQNIDTADSNYWSPVTPVEQLVNNGDLKEPLAIKVEEPCFAVIDIYNNGTTNTSYDLFVPGPENKLKSPVYTIRFKSKI